MGLLTKAGIVGGLLLTAVFAKTALVGWNDSHIQNVFENCASVQECEQTMANGEPRP